MKDGSIKHKNFESILKEFILPGYRSYRGADAVRNPIAQLGQILNNQDRIIILNEMLGNEPLDTLPPNIKQSAMVDIISVLNMCSTDYSADVVQELLAKIQKMVDAYVQQL